MSCAFSQRTDEDFILHCGTRKDFSITTLPPATGIVMVLFSDRKEWQTSAFASTHRLYKCFFIFLCIWWRMTSLFFHRTTSFSHKLNTFRSVLMGGLFPSLTVEKEKHHSNCPVGFCLRLHSRVVIIYFRFLSQSGDMLLQCYSSAAQMKTTVGHI